MAGILPVLAVIEVARYANLALQLTAASLASWNYYIGKGVHMERPLTGRGLATIALVVIGGLVQSSVAAEPSGLHLLRSAIALGVAPDGSPIEVKTFYKDERIQFYTKVSSDPTRGSGENHRLLYKWYTGDTVSFPVAGQKRFDASPTYWSGFMDVSHLTPGHHRVELFIDDQLFADSAFDIKASDRPYEPEEETAIKDSAVTLLLAGDTQHFDELASRYRASEERTTSGTWKLSMLYNAIDAHSFSPADPRWKVVQDVSDAWLVREPDSPTAVVLDARILYDYAWAVRGEDADSNVPAQNAQLYRQLIERARGVLDQHPGVARQDPEWDTLRIPIARQQGADSTEILAMADRALTRWPCFYAIHNAVTNALLPRSGGSRQAIQAYVKLAMEHSRAREGTEAYARIYYYIARTAREAPLEDLNLMGAKWPPFQQSLDEILKKYPSSFNQDIARYMAAVAGDAPAYRAYGRADTGAVIPIAWWDWRGWRQNADAWAFEGKYSSESLMGRVRSYFTFWLGEGPEFWGPLRWGAVVLIFLIEGGFSILNRLALRSNRQWSLPPGATGTLNRFDYPREYFVIPVFGRFSTRLGVWMLVFGAGAAYLLTTIPWANPQETAMVMAGLIILATAGAFIAINALVSRVVLRADDLKLQRLAGGKMIARSDILGIRRRGPQAGLWIVEVVPRIPGIAPLFIPPVLHADDAFRVWFESFPAVAEDHDEEHSTRDDLR